MDDIKLEDVSCAECKKFICDNTMKLTSAFTAFCSAKCLESYVTDKSDVCIRIRRRSGEVHLSVK